MLGGDTQATRGRRKEGDPDDGPKQGTHDHQDDRRENTVNRADDQQGAEANTANDICDQTDGEQKDRERRPGSPAHPGLRELPRIGLQSSQKPQVKAMPANARASSQRRWTIDPAGESWTSRSSRKSGIIR